MKETFLVVGIIAAGILTIVLLLNNSPDLLTYNINDTDKPIVTKPKFPDLEYSIVTSEPSFWDQVAGLKKEVTTVKPIVTDENGNEVTAIPVTDENGNEVTAVTGTNDNDEKTDTKKKTKKDKPVTTVPD